MHVRVTECNNAGLRVYLCDICTSLSC